MPRRTTPPTPETPLHELWNLSRTTATWLEELGVKTYGDLCQRDLHQLWLDLKLRHSQVTKLMAYALWGAVHNQHWEQTSESEKEAFEVFRKSL